MAQLGFIITSSPHGGAGARSFYLLAAAALDKGYTVKAFFCEDGVYQCLSKQTTTGTEFSSADYLRSIQDKGAEIVVSSSCMKLRGISPDSLCDVKFGTYDALRRMMVDVDRMVCL